MAKKKKRGFTLPELLVALTISLIVMSVGYRIINQISFVLKSQDNISKTQLSFNSIIAIMSKDIEGSKEIILPAKEDEYLNMYKYQLIQHNGKVIEYIVVKDSGKYTFKKIVNNSEIVLINKQEFESNSPVTITNDGALYKVSIEYYWDKKSNMYEFKATMRGKVIEAHEKNKR